MSEREQQTAKERLDAFLRDEFDGAEDLRAGLREMGIERISEEYAGDLAEIYDIAGADVRR